MTERLKYEHTTIAADSEAARIARSLKKFLAKRTRKIRLQPNRPNSFDEILRPAIDFAIDRLRQASPTSRSLRQLAWNDLRRHLMTRLGFALTPTLRLQRNAARAAGCRDDITLLETTLEFPELFDTATRLISGWLNAQTEVLVRILRDKKNLGANFFKKRLQMEVTHIRPGLSDPHDGGRSVTVVEFARGLRLIYKPRSANREELWFNALRWLNRQQLGVSFRIPKFLPRSRYLWMEFLAKKSCHSIAEVRRFYFRWGAQTALAQILGAIDLHRDNWLAVGSQPMLVDLEFVGLKPKRGGKTLDRPASAKTTAGAQSLPALLETGLFPLTSRDRAGSYHGIAPFDSSSLERGPFTCWPRYKRAIQPPWKYVSELVRGFEAVAEIFSDIRLAKDFFQEVLARSAKNGTDRILPRATAQYARLLRESFKPRNMVSRGARWRALEHHCSLSAMNRRIGLAEARALLRCDIPKFTTRPGSSFVSWKRFLVAIAELKDSSRILRRRVLFRSSRRAPRLTT